MSNYANLTTTAARIEGIESILRRRDPGPGGFYDDLSAPWAQSHIVTGEPFAEDPDFMTGPLRRFPYRKVPGPLRREWRTFTGPWHFNPMQMRYTGLDPEARYTLRVVYSCHKANVPLRLTAQNGIEIHPFVARGRPTFTRRVRCAC